MNTPQRKFFDIVKKEFPKNQDCYFINNQGIVVFSNFYSTDNMARHSMDVAKNIIDVPFTGIYGKNETPAYENDLVNTYDYEGNFLHVSVIRKCGSGAWEAFREDDDGWVLAEYENEFEIIGSALTNPELLEDK